MSQYNKLPDIQYARFQILPVDFHFGLFCSAGIPTVTKLSYSLSSNVRLLIHMLKGEAHVFLKMCHVTKNEAYV